MYLSTGKLLRRQRCNFMIFSGSLLLLVGCLSTEQQVVSVLGPWMIMNEPAASDRPATNRVQDNENSPEMKSRATPANTLPLGTTNQDG